MLSTLPLVLALLAACVEDVGKDKVQAVVEDVPEAPAEARPATEGVVLGIDEEQSKLQALGAKITAKHPIVFHDWDGQVTVKDGALAGLSFVAQVASLEADHPRLTEHLKNEDFFDVPNHPTASFESTKITEGAEADGMTHTVTGTLTIRGNSKQVTFPAKIDVKEGAVTASTEFTVNRQDFGITYPGKPDDLVQDNVVLTISFVADEPQA